MTMVLRSTAPLLLHRMRIVEAHQALASRTVQGERIVEAMRFLDRCWHPRYNEPDPVLAFWIDNEDLPVQGKSTSRVGSRDFNGEVITK